MKACWMMIGMLLWQLSWADEVFPVVLPECSARLERPDTEAVLMVRSDCPLSLNSLARLLDEGLRGLFNDHAIEGVHAVYLGRLMNYPDWSRSLASAAAESPAWDSRRGRPGKKGESYNHRVATLLNGAAYPQELKPVFSRYGLMPCIADVEKVLVYEASEIFPQAGDIPKKVSPSARLPVDAQIWLSLRPMSSDCAKH